jgi:hypothetical protein
VNLYAGCIRNSVFQGKSTNQERIQIKLTNLYEAVVYQQQAAVQKGENLINLKTDKLKSGVYFVTVTGGSNHSIYKQQIQITRFE